MSPFSTKLSTAKNRKRNLPYLPDDLLLSCFARVSRSYYPTLSLVSKRFLSLVTSLELYQIRTLSNCTESCLYVCLLDDCYEPRLFTLCKRPTLEVNPNPRSQWFSPCYRPFKILMNCTRKKERKPSDDNSLVPIPSRNFLYFEGSCATIGSYIYIIGGLIGREPPSSRVLFMDCRTHTWHEAPNMRIARTRPQTSVLDGKIYVMEANKDCCSSGWMEVFDPITQIWEDVPGPDEEMRGTNITRSLAINGNLYLFGDKMVVYNPKENRWEAVALEMRVDEIRGMYMGATLGSICEIDNIMYLYRFYPGLEWYNYETRSWKLLKGLKELTQLLTGFDWLKLVNFGGKIAVLWQKTTLPISLEKIWCAVIALQRRNKYEIYGKVEWFDTLTVPKSVRKSVHLMKLIVATV